MICNENYTMGILVLKSSVNKLPCHLNTKNWNVEIKHSSLSTSNMGKCRRYLTILGQQNTS